MPPAPAAYRARPAPPGLAPWVECAWEVAAGPDGRMQRVLPDGCMDIVFVDGRGLEAVGANVAAFLSAIPPGGSAVGVRMRPGGAPPLLGISGEALLDARPPAAEVLGDDARRLEERLAAAPSAPARADAILGWIADRARRAERPDPVVARVAERLAGDSRAAVTDLADETGIGARHLRRRVVREVGYGPRRLARVLRLQRTVALAAADPDAGLSELAFRAGYSDQSHLSHECRELAGLPPSQLLAR
ncbi:MAG TPA: helix-turn-helix domain-containing protein [Miltoncostaea sp.]|nr:helix-turn-helix domain-containing protein [Miltoncostaea sp.]